MKILLLVISIIIPTAIATWFLLDEFVYGYKAQIKRLWKEIFRRTHLITQLERKDDSVATLIASDTLKKLKTTKDRTGKLINALLDYYYADTEDEGEQEYVRDNRYKEKN